MRRQGAVVAVDQGDDILVAGQIADQIVGQIIGLPIGDRQALRGGFRAGVRQGNSREIDTGHRRPPVRHARRIETRAAAQIADGFAGQAMPAVDPVDGPVDGLKPARGQVRALIQVIVQHLLRDPRIGPKRLDGAPRKRLRPAVEIVQDGVHCGAVP